MKSGVYEWVGLAVLASMWAANASAQTVGGAVVYRCPGNPVLYTDAISAKEAKEKGCSVLEGRPITVIQSPKPRSAAPAAGQTSGPAATRVDPADQRARDSDARRILEAELRREEDRLATMRVEFNNGQPDRLGSESNFQRYLDRVADMKTAIARKESDIVALKREIAKHPQ
jgi:hypothetical protein